MWEHRIVGFNSTQPKAGIRPYSGISSPRLDQIKLRKPTWRPLIDADAPQ